MDESYVTVSVLHILGVQAIDILNEIPMMIS